MGLGERESTACIFSSPTHWETNRRENQKKQRLPQPYPPMETGNEAMQRDLVLKITLSASQAISINLKNEVIFNYQILFLVLTSLISFSHSPSVGVCCWDLTKSLGYLRQDCLSCGLLVTGLQKMINGRVTILMYWPGSLGLWPAPRNQTSGQFQRH